jgi:hypothetical protein
MKVTFFPVFLSMLLAGENQPRVICPKVVMSQVFWMNKPVTWWVPWRRGQAPGWRPGSERMLPVVYSRGCIQLPCCVSPLILNGFSSFLCAFPLGLCHPMWTKHLFKDTKKTRLCYGPHKLEAWEETSYLRIITIVLCLMTYFKIIRASLSLLFSLVLACQPWSWLSR